jgi:HK97 family phage major capsid protein
LNWPTNNDSAVVCQQLAINTSVITLTQTELTFGQFALDAYKFTSGSIICPTELLQDSIIDMEAFVIKQLTTRMWRGLNAQWTTGTGSTAINGVVTAATYAAIPSTDNTTVSRNNIVDLQHSVNSIYRPGAKYMMNDATLLAIKKLAFGTSDDRPLWQSGMAFNAPDTLEGFPYIINPDVASMEAGAKPLLFGDFSNYYIREIAEWRILRLAELYALSDQIGFVVFARYDGDLDDAGTHPVKYLLNATAT